MFYTGKTKQGIYRLRAYLKGAYSGGTYQYNGTWLQEAAYICYGEIVLFVCSCHKH